MDHLSGSFQAFFKDLEQAKTEADRAVLKFQFDLATRILTNAQKNIRRIFGRKGGDTPRSPLTMRAWGGSGRSKGASGGLLGSGQLGYTDDKTVVVSFGGPGVPYARIQEEGGVINPRNSTYLTIPFHPRYAGKRAEEFDLNFAVDETWGPVLMVESWGKRKGSVDGQIDPKAIAYLLRKRVTIPARPYLRPAVDEATKGQVVKSMMKRLLNTDKIEVK